MQRKTITAIGAGVAAAGLTFGLIAVAQADDATAPDGTAAVAAADDATQGSGAADQGGRGGQGETALTGTDAEKATAAAQAAVPDGTVMRVETDNDGVYEAHVRKSDGTEVVVKMDDSFAVTSVDQFAGRGGPGGHGRGGPSGDATSNDSGSTATSSFGA